MIEQTEFLEEKKNVQRMPQIRIKKQCQTNKTLSPQEEWQYKATEAFIVRSFE